MDTWIWTEPAATARRGRGREGIWWRWCVSDRAVGRIWSLALEKPGGGGTLVDGTGVAGRKSLHLRESVSFRANSVRLTGGPCGPNRTRYFPRKRLPRPNLGRLRPPNPFLPLLRFLCSRQAFLGSARISNQLYHHSTNSIKI